VVLLSSVQTGGYQASEYTNTLSTIVNNIEQVELAKIEMDKYYKAITVARRDNAYAAAAA
jgi:hypothetical protein